MVKSSCIYLIIIMLDGNREGTLIKTGEENATKLLMHHWLVKKVTNIASSLKIMYLMWFHIKSTSFWDR